MLNPPGLRVTLAGGISVDGIGPHQRILGPLLIDKVEAAPILTAYRYKDLAEAAAAFELAFARSYGASRVEIIDVVRLHMEPVTGH